MKGGFDATHPWNVLLVRLLDLWELIEEVPDDAVRQGDLAASTTRCVLALALRILGGPAIVDELG